MVTLGFGLLGLGVYLGSVVSRARRLQSQPVRWEGQPFEPDRALGYRLRPGAQAFQRLAFGERVPVAIGADGLRWPVGHSPGAEAPRILFLGDSFTHGFGVPAEDAFPAVAARALGAEALNAGGPGWGLSQMVVRARELIPKLRPRLVVAQLSTTVIERALRPTAPSYWGRLPVPYMHREEGLVAIQPPVSEPIAFDLPIARYAGDDFLPFLWHVGLPLLLHDDLGRTAEGLRRSVGGLPPPLRSHQAAVDFAYAEMAALCREVGARLVVLGLHWDPNDRIHVSLSALPASCTLVDTYQPLLRRLEAPTPLAWARSYAIWRGDPPVPVDPHPNRRAHRLIAEVLLTALRGGEDPPGD